MATCRQAKDKKLLSTLAQELSYPGQKSIEIWVDILSQLPQIRLCFIVFMFLQMLLERNKNSRSRRDRDSEQIQTCPQSKKDSY